MKLMVNLTLKNRVYIAEKMHPTGLSLFDGNGELVKKGL